MSIFKKKILEINKSEKIIDPIKLYGTCPYKESYGYLRGIQEEVLNEWFHNRYSDRDIICKMNTGSGKTLTGLLMLYSKMNETKLPSIFLCPDLQLVDQTIELSRNYGIPTVNSENELPLEFLNAEKILVTSFQKLFNGKSKFNKDNIELGAVLIDDAHKCLDIARTQSCIKIDRDSSRSAIKLFTLFEEVIKDQHPGDYRALINKEPFTYVKIPYWTLENRKEEILKLIAEEIQEENSQNKFSFHFFASNQNIYECYISSEVIEFEPIHVPYNFIESFNEAKFRYILSATFEDDYDLIKDLGISGNAVSNPIIPKNRNDIGKRLILSPQKYNNSLKEIEAMQYVLDIKDEFKENTIILVPSIGKAKKWIDLGAVLLDKRNISENLKKLESSKGNFFVIANRYEGLDLYNNLCRILVIDGIPSYNSIKELYTERILRDLLSSKKAQIIEQGLGRATRSGADYAVVFLLGKDLLSFLGLKKNLTYFTEIGRKHLQLGFELLDAENNEITYNDIKEAVDACLNQDPDWHNYHTRYMNLDNFAIINDRSKIVKLAEIESRAINKFKQRNPSEACSIIVKEIINDENNEFGEGFLKDVVIAWYYQLAAHFEYYNNKVESNNLQIKAIELSTKMFTPTVPFKHKKLKPITNQSQNIISYINKFTSYHDLALFIKENLNDLQYSPEISFKKFENALVIIGKFLGFNTSSPENDKGNGPDVLWALTNNTFLIMEAKSMATHEKISRDNIQQLLGSVEWFKKNYPEETFYAVTLQKSNQLENAVNISEETRCIDEGHLKELKYRIDQFLISLNYKGLLSLDQENVNKLLVQYKLTSDNLVNTFLKKPQ